MYADRIALLKQIEARQKSRAILYVTGDRPGLETQIHPEVYDYFVNLLDDIGLVERISLILYTRGGSTLAAWSLVNLIHQFCDEFEVIIPSKARSAGTLISIGAKRIVMTKQATLGPIDPSLTGPLNPGIQGAPPDARVPVSVEAVNGYVELCKSSMDKPSACDMKDLLVALTEKIHPLVLGEVYRSKTQIQMLAKKLLSKTAVPPEKVEPIIAFLCSDSGSHDYSIHRREARQLGLQVDKPDDQFYREIKSLYDDFAGELRLTNAWNPINEIGSQPMIVYSNKRSLVESTTGGSYFFATEGRFSRQTAQNGMTQFQDERIFEGWKHEPAP